MKKIIFYFVFFILSFTCIYADYDVRQYSNITISGSCISSNNGVCNESTICIMNIQYPNGSIYVNATQAELMTPYWYFNISSTNITGIYNSVIACCYDSICDNSIFKINIYAGNLDFNTCPTSGKGLTSLIILIGLAILFIVIGAAYRWGIIGMIGGVILIISSWYLSGCNSLLAFIVALAGVLFVTGFSFKKWW